MDRSKPGGPRYGRAYRRLAKRKVRVDLKCQPFTQRTKSDLIPSLARLLQAEPLIASSYVIYETQPDLKLAVRSDAGQRFANLPSNGGFADRLATETVRFIEEVANARSVARF